MNKSFGLFAFVFLSLLLAGRTFAASVPADRVSLYMSREDGNLEEILVSLYDDVQKGGYIWVVSSALTQPGIAKAVVEAKRRGVDVRLITDRKKLDSKRDEIAMYNLKRLGVPIKINRFNGELRLEASVVDGRYVVVGSYNYGSVETRTLLGRTSVDEESLLVIPAGVDGQQILQQYKNQFERMWNDEKSYQSLP